MFVLVIQVARVFYYLSAAALQYLAPTILLLFSVLTLRTLGRFYSPCSEIPIYCIVILISLPCNLLCDFWRQWLRKILFKLRPRSNVDLHARRT